MNSQAVGVGVGRAWVGSEGAGLRISSLLIILATLVMRGTGLPDSL